MIEDKSLFWGRLVTKYELKNTLKGSLNKEMESVPCIVSEGYNYRCSRCNNQNQDKFDCLPAQNQFGREKALNYCLNCVQMGRMIEGEFLYHLPEPKRIPYDKDKVILTWEGKLSTEQIRASKDLIESLQIKDKAHLVYAVTGAGKTEMIFPVIAHVLKNGGRVGVVSPRIDVCLEIAPRLQQAFSEIDLMLLYGGQDEVYRYTQLVVATTHQLLRFKSAFDLLIVDEVDAFPYVNDDSLHFAVERAVIANNGKRIYLTATPDSKLQKQLKKQQITQTVLPARYHRHPLPEPEFKWIGDWRMSILKKQEKSLLLRTIQMFLNLEGIKLIFMPSIYLAETLYVWLKSVKLGLKIACVHSKDPFRKEKVQDLRDGIYDSLVTTTILERGVTFTHCHVLIIGSESPLYSTSALVQMSGRVGRKWDYPSGTLVYAHFGVSKSMLDAKKQIKQMNKQAKKRGLLND